MRSAVRTLTWETSRGTGRVAVSVVIQSVRRRRLTSTVWTMLTVSQIMCPGHELRCPRVSVNHVLFLLFMRRKRRTNTVWTMPTVSQIRCPRASVSHMLSLLFMRRRRRTSTVWAMLTVKSNIQISHDNGCHDNLRICDLSR